MIPSANRKIVIGLTGPIGSGVTTVSKVLAEMDFLRYKVSDTIAKHLGDVSPKDRREKLQNLGDSMRVKHGPHYWLEQTLVNVGEKQNVVIDGIKNLGEVNWLRQNCSNAFIGAVVAPREERWDRLKGRPEYAGDEGQFDRDDKRDWEQEADGFGQQVHKCVLAADHVFINERYDASSAERSKKLRADFEKVVGIMDESKPHLPSTDELHMATAYAQSHASQCLKRQVGAVIVDPNGIPLSIGFNENPVGMAPCRTAYGFCYKDDDMHKKLERMHGVRCTNCGAAQKDGVKKPWLCTACGFDLKKKLFPSRNLELCTAIHAEERAIRSLPGGKAPDATMYVTTFPCFQCARYIVDAKIRRVVYVEAYPVKESIRFLDMNKVKVDAFTGFKARAFNIVFKGVS